MPTNSHIKCHVNRCKFNDQARHCTLNDIVVGCSTPAPHNKCDTECDSFEECTV
ncbi:MAG: DUF1540 domain-containing protein [Defluviitaleaceae bacterium]|nr:DUF1540 domain-containing protein [Defluviitaleaceae bacterium]